MDDEHGVHQLDVLGTLGDGPTAYLNRPCPELPFYFESYKLGAQSLYSAIAASPEKATDLALPWLFLRRHYVELLLKANLEQMAEANTRNPRHPMGHSLSGLWSRLWGPDPPAAEREAEMHMKCARVIAELDLLDPLSATFRYPADENGDSTLRRFPSKLDLRMIEAHLNDLDEYLETVFYQSDHALERLRIERMIPPNLVDLVENQWRTASQKKREHWLFLVEHGARNGLIPGRQLHPIHVALKHHRTTTTDEGTASWLDAVLEEVGDLFLDRREDKSDDSG